MKLQKVSPWVFSLIIHAIPVLLLSLNLMGGKGNAAAGEENGVEQQEPEHRELTDITIIEAPPEMPEPEPEQTPEPEPQPLAQDDDESIPSLDKEFIDLLKNRPPVVEPDDDCFMHFNGIGVEYSNVTKKTVGRTYPGYPAERAGLQPGDVIETVTGEDIIGQVGTSFELRITRNGRTWTQTLTREKICFKRNNL